METTEITEGTANVLGALARLGTALALIAMMACAARAPGPAPVDAGTARAAEDDFEPFDTPPSIEWQIEPVYPEYAKRNHVEGSVVIRVTLSAKGKVEETRVIESSNRMFDAPALEAVRQFRFKPARKDGQPVRSRVVVPIQFRL